ncbi:MAG: sn-glycerol-3-phosphate ABC transporter ATP-binding protein UgpC [Immundisolibacter sp.]
MAAVRLQQVRKSFGPVDVIPGIDLHIQPRELVVFVGPSGCGKSTLLRLIAGLEEVSDGRIHIGERDVTDLPPAARGVSMVFQSYALYPHMDVYRNIAFGLKLARTDRRAVDRKVREAARMLQIDELLRRRPRELSGGQRQRVAIARAIVRDPQVFLFDEPLSNLDAALRVQTRIEIARMHQRFDASMIYVTHDQVEAMTLADRMVVLNRGRVEQVGPPTELYRRPANVFVAGFLGSPTMNLLPVDVTDGTAALPGGGRLALGEVPLRGPATLGLRPEHLQILTAGGGKTAFSARLELVEELGEARIVHLRLADGTSLTVRHHHDNLPASGETVAVGPTGPHWHLFDADGRRVAGPD